MIYLERFILPDMFEEQELCIGRAVENGGSLTTGYIDNIYPAGIFPGKGFSRTDFEDITIFCGGNGSGKSTLLNLIAERCSLERLSPFNSSELFGRYCGACRAELREGADIPSGSRIITSDDVFEYMLSVRDNNDDIAEKIEEAKSRYFDIKFRETIKFSGMQDYEDLHMQLLSRRKSRRQFIKEMTGSESRLFSNGETALEFFSARLGGSRLYLLDEPENSLSPKLQMMLAGLIEDLRAEGSQIIMATHSPFLLAIRGAKIYDLDSSPVDVKRWSELESVRTWFEFFESRRDEFLG